MDWIELSLHHPKTSHSKPVRHVAGLALLYYIIHIELIGLFTALLLYLPFALRDRHRNRSLALE
ncbi:MAG: hypothetical protein Kow0088_04680 [Anaerolineales bacterium]